MQVSDVPADVLSSSNDPGFLYNESWPPHSKLNSSNNTSFECYSVCQPDACYNRSECLKDVMYYIYPSSYEWLLIFLYCIVFIVGLAGNFLVCFAVWRNPSMRTVTNYFIVNLALADFLVILVCMPPTVLEDVANTWYIGDVLCKIIKYIQAVSVSVSVFTLSCIAVERWYAICHPLKFKSTPKRAKMMIFFIWLVALVIMLPEMISVGTIPHRDLPPDFRWLTMCKPTWSHKMSVGFQCFTMVALYFLPLLLTFITYLLIARCLWSTSIPTECSRDHLQPSSCPTGAETQLRSRRKAAKMLIAVVIMFAICYLPVHLLNILGYAHVLDNMGEEELTILALIAHWLCYFNSAINPVIYNFMSAKFRKEFRHACVCCFTQRDVRIARHATASYSYKYTNSLNTRTSNTHSPCGLKRLETVNM